MARSTRLLETCGCNSQYLAGDLGRKLEDENFCTCKRKSTSHTSGSLSHFDPHAATNISSRPRYNYNCQPKASMELNSCECQEHKFSGEVGQMVANFRPNPGDIIILQTERKPLYPQIYGGFVSLYKDDNFFERTLKQDQLTLDGNYTQDFIKGDIVVRMGMFDNNWQWHPGDVVHVFVCEGKHLWRLAGKVGRHPLQPPVKRDLLDGPHMTVPSRDCYFKPRDGDLILRGVPNTDNVKKWHLLWWHPHMDIKHFDMLLRIGFDVSRKSLNHDYVHICVEMYSLYETLQYWIFVGRDSYTYERHKNSSTQHAYTIPLSHSNMSTGWKHIQDILNRTNNKTFFRVQKPGKQKRVLDQSYDHHLPDMYDHLGFDDLESE